MKNLAILGAGLLLLNVQRLAGVAAIADDCNCDCVPTRQPGTTKRPPTPKPRPTAYPTNRRTKEPTPEPTLAPIKRTKRPTPREPLQNSRPTPFPQHRTRRPTGPTCPPGETEATHVAHVAAERKAALRFSNHTERRGLDHQNRRGLNHANKGSDGGHHGGSKGDTKHRRNMLHHG